MLYKNAVHNIQIYHLEKVIFRVRKCKILICFALIYFHILLYNAVLKCPSEFTNLLNALCLFHKCFFDVNTLQGSHKFQLLSRESYRCH